MFPTIRPGLPTPRVLPAIGQAEDPGPSRRPPQQQQRPRRRHHRTTGSWAVSPTDAPDQQQLGGEYFTVQTPAGPQRVVLPVQRSEAMRHSDARSSPSGTGRGGRSSRRSSWQVMTAATATRVEGSRPRALAGGGGGGDSPRPADLRPSAVVPRQQHRAPASDLEGADSRLHPGGPTQQSAVDPRPPPTTDGRNATNSRLHPGGATNRSAVDPRPPPTAAIDPRPRLEEDGRDSADSRLHTVATSRSATGPRPPPEAVGGDTRPRLISFIGQPSTGSWQPGQAPGSPDPQLQPRRPPEVPGQEDSRSTPRPAVAATAPGGPVTRARPHPASAATDTAPPQPRDGATGREAVTVCC